MLNKHDCYELCVQNPAACATMLTHLHGGSPGILVEDFCGSAALSRSWIASDPSRHALAVDLDAQVLEEARRRIEQEHLDAARIELIHADVTKTSSIAKAQPKLPPDVVFVGNFSIGEIHKRATLIAYMRLKRDQLASGGILIVDTYCGSSAWRTGGLTRTHHIQPNTRVHYTWQQFAVDPVSCRAENHLHFRVENDGEVVQEYPDAFVYHWRLWSPAELKDAMLEAGFAQVNMHEHFSAMTRIDESAFRAVCVVGRI